MGKKQIQLPETNQERTLLEEFLFYLSYLIRHRILIILVTLGAAVGGVIFSVLSLMLPPDKSPLPNYYHAYAVLIVGQEETTDMTTMLATLGIQVPIGTEEMNYGELALRVLNSRPFIDGIVEKHNMIERYDIRKKVKTNSRKIVIENSRTEYDSRTGTLNIGYEDTDPKFARDVVETMVTNLKAWFQKWDGTSSQQQLVAMEEKLKEVSEEISLLEEEIQIFQSEYGVMSVNQMAETQASMIAELQSQLIQTEIAIKNYSGFSTIKDQELIQLQTQRDSLQQLINQIEQGESGGSTKLPSKEKLPALAIEYSHLQMSHEIQMRIFQNLKEQYEIQRLTSIGTSVFSELEPAEIPDEKSRPRRSQLCIIVTIVGFIFSIVLAAAIDIIHNIKKDPKKQKILKGDSSN